jgi:hypothetical protein
MTATSEDQAISRGAGTKFCSIAERKPRSGEFGIMPARGKPPIKKRMIHWALAQSLGFHTKAISKFGVETTLSDAVQRCLKSAVVEIGLERGLEVRLSKAKCLRCTANRVFWRLCIRCSTETACFFLEDCICRLGLAQSAVSRPVSCVTCDRGNPPRSREIHG